jgi:hypothetical protein
MCVIEVLLAACRVDTRRLEVSPRIHADPRLAPRRRYRQLRDPFEDLWVIDALVVGIAVFETVTAPAPADSGGGAARSS